MSAAVVRGFAPEAARMPSSTARTRLRLVGSDERVGQVKRVGPDKRGKQKRFKVVGPNERVEAYAPACVALRLNRRGRLVITLALTAAVVALAVVLASSVDAAVPGIDHVSTVLTGRTLSEVAAAQLPSLPIHEAVARIQLVNGLNTDQVHAGQSLLIPAMR